LLVRIEGFSEVGEARRMASEAARVVDFDEESIGRVALLATEIATNLVKHGGGGDLIVEQFSDSDGSGIEILGLDKGPGMADVERCLGDGFSTAGSAGSGLGAVQRMSSRFAVFSRPSGGTALLARLLRNGDRPSGTGLSTEIGAIAVPYPGETECGDAWAVGSRQDGTLFVVDGLGHGPLAAAAARTAKETFIAHQNEDCVALGERIHRALAPTRGAAMAIVRVDRDRGLVRFVGIGNIAGTILSQGKIRKMVSHNGIAGHRAPHIAEFTYPFSGELIVILHSDGISARWDLADYPGLTSLHASVIAGVLYRDFQRGRDDATIVVLRMK
jgi:anti-sigma regulatory factor (Ser/Thr protein kinase)